MSLANGSFEYARQHNHAAVGIKPGVKNQRLQPVFRIPFGRRHTLHDFFQNIGHALAGLGADQNGVRGVETHCPFDHFLRTLDIGAGQVNLVDDGNNFQTVVDGEIGIGQRLRFHALRSVHNQQRTFAGSQRARDFIGEVDVTRGVDEIELVEVAILRRVHHADGMRLDGDAALPFQVHGVKYLGLHLARGQRAGQFQQTICQRGLAMINMCNDGKIANKCSVDGGSGQYLIRRGHFGLQSSGTDQRHEGCCDPGVAPRPPPPI